MTRQTLLLCVVSTALLGVARSSTPDPAAAPIPAIERAPDGHARLLVDGAPFLMLGAQAHNSSASDPAAMDRFFEGVAAIGANTAEAPIYWELLEPEPGRYDFALVDALVEKARAAHVRLVLLWFASWKNGEMQYAPAWVKQDRATYARVVGPGGDERDILSPLSAAARDADARAFAALMRHVRSIDEATRTVILVQIENETGLLGADRDHSPASDRMFAADVPADLTAYLAAHRQSLGGDLERAWAAGGRRASGTWTEVFGPMDAEAFTAWHIARYVDAVATAGKREYPLPMYVNAWLVNPGDERPGRWPSGGPTAHVLDVWKAAAPHIDLLAPDIYQPKAVAIASQYARPDNPLFVPEIALNPHYAAFPFAILARLGGIGVAPFGVDGGAEGEAGDGIAEYARDYRVLKPLLPLITRYQGSDALQAVVQDEDWAQVLRVGPRVRLVAHFRRPYDPGKAIGRALVMSLAPDDLVIAGAGVDFEVRDLQQPMSDPNQWAIRQPILSMEEGTFDGDRWVAGRRLNGDERRVQLGPDGATIRVRLLLR